MSKKAFTLIELLVVISIIALMISILLPALKSARESARAIQCASNIRQFAIVTELYLQDHEGWFYAHYDSSRPGHWYDGDGPLVGKRYLTIANNTFKSAGTVGDCPTNTTGYYAQYGWYLDYGLNKHVTGRRQQMYRRASDSLLFVDNADSTIYASAHSYVGINSPGLWSNPEQVQYIHPESANVVHMDGHVSRYKMDDITNAMFLP